MMDRATRKKKPPQPLIAERGKGYESFSADGDELVRTVSLSQGGTVSSRLPVGEAVTRAEVAEDLASSWDQAFLRAPSLAPWRAHRGHVVVVDLFCGVGGMSLGVREACRALGLGFEVACAVDMEASALSTYEENFGARTGHDLDLGGLSSILGSSRTAAEVRLTNLVHGSPDILLAGPPCQGHSNLNNHTRRIDPKNELYFKTVRAVELLKPQLVIIENVPTVTSDKRGVVNRSLSALVELGYDVHAGVVSLASIGVAQTRKRHVLIAQKSVGAPPSPRAFVSDVTTAFATRPRSLHWAIGDLLGATNASLFDSLPEMSEVTKERVEYLFEQDLYDLPDSQRPDCHRDGEHTYQSVYGRMRWDRPAPTITSGFFTMGRGRFIHPERRSVMTAHEAARVQFFPDSFSWGAQTTRRGLAMAIGNAVPPKLSYAFALAALR